MEVENLEEIVNYAHLTALLEGAETVRCAEIDGIRVLSNGKIAFVHDAWLVPTVSDANNKLRDYWASMTGDGDPLPISKMGICSDRFVRVIGDWVIDEAYFRALHQDGFEWFSNGDQLHVWSERKRVAIVLRMRVYPESVLDASATDEQVFEFHACESNGWYLQSEKPILAEIVKLEKKNDNLRERAEELESEIEDNIGRIKALRKKVREKQLNPKDDK